MNPSIVKIQDKILMGINLRMNLIGNKTTQLWQTFSPRISEIQNKASADRYSLQIYPQGYFKPFDPQSECIKWAAVEVNQTANIPTGMNTLTLKEGLYAAFITKAQVQIHQFFSTSTANGFLNLHTI